MQPLKAGDAAAFRKLFNFLIKCQTMRVGSKHNPLDTPESASLQTLFLVRIMDVMQSKQGLDDGLLAL